VRRPRPRRKNVHEREHLVAVGVEQPAVDGDAGTIGVHRVDGVARVRHRALVAHERDEAAAAPKVRSGRRWTNSGASNVASRS